jgi:restriction endonuclease Mrr
MNTANFIIMPDPGSQLAQYMIDHDLGVSISETIYIKTLDTDYFEVE